MTDALLSLCRGPKLLIRVMQIQTEVCEYVITSITRIKLLIRVMQIQ